MPARMIVSMLVALLISIPIFAQEISASKEADIRLLLKLSGVVEMQDLIVTEMLKPMSELLEGLLSPERASDFVADLSAKFSERLGAKIIPEALPIYDKYFTHDDIKDMLQYLESPVGRKALQLQSQITQELMYRSSVIGKKIMSEILLELEAQYPELRIADHEASAISSVRDIVVSQITYWATSGEGNYAVDLGVLESADLIDSALGSGTKDGYAFSTSGDASTFTGSATPLTFGSTGTRSFFVDETGVIRYTREDRPATVEDLPLGQ